MPLSDKNIVITPATNTNGQPTIRFTAGTVSTVNTITFKVLDTGPISIEGNAGQLMSIVDSNTGTLFSVNDISGIPSIEVLDTGVIKLAGYGGQVWIGTNTNTTTTTGLSVGGIINASGLTITGKKAVNGPAFRAYISVGQTIASAGAQVKVTFGGETFDTDGCFASSTFTPTVEGYYQLNATVRISGPAGTGENMLILYKNGSEYARGTNGSGTEIGGNFYSMQASDIVYANGTTDNFEVYIQQGSGSNKDTTAGQNISYFSGVMVRGA
jgi:hypothetical protein